MTASDRTASSANPPVVLVISGLDPSAGAGYALDLRVAMEHGGAGCGAVTALTVQDSVGARRCEPVSAELVGEQLGAILSDYEVAAVKVGLVPSGDVARAIAGALQQTAAPIVWDPVFAASRGATLLHDDPRAIAEIMLPEVLLVTPNLGEAAILGDSGEAIRRAFGCAVLITGGHGSGAVARDVLFTGDGQSVFEAERVSSAPVRGTGCYLSTAIATRLGCGQSMLEAIEHAKQALTARLRVAAKRGRGAAVLW